VYYWPHIEVLSLASPPAKTEQRRNAQLKRIQSELSAHLTGGTKIRTGITGRERTDVLARKIKSLKVRGQSKLERAFGKRAVHQIIINAKVDALKKYLSLRKELTPKKGLPKVPSRKELLRIPEDILREANISTVESELIGKRSGLTHWRSESLGTYWKDQKGRFSKGPRTQRSK
jgi:hypothetical protein